PIAKSPIAAVATTWIANATLTGFTPRLRPPNSPWVRIAVPCVPERRGREVRRPQRKADHADPQRRSIADGVGEQAAERGAEDDHAAVDRAHGGVHPRLQGVGG